MNGSMEYHLLAQPLKADPAGLKFLHGIEFKIAPRRYQELEAFLADRVGPKHETWRTQARFLNSSWSTDPVRGSLHPESIVVRFVDKAQAFLFKMSWNQCVVPVSTSPYANTSKVLLPIIRRAAPAMIAKDILGVQPMTGSVGDAIGTLASNALRVRYDAYAADNVPRELSAEEIAANAERERQALERRTMTEAIQEWDQVVNGVEPTVTKTYVDGSRRGSVLEEILENTRQELDRLAARNPLPISKAQSATRSGNEE